MKHSRILAEISQMQWAILPDALSAIVARVDGLEFTAEDRVLFHAVSEDQNLKLLSDLGEPVEGARYSYVKDNIGLMLIDGPIIPRADFFSEMSGMVSVERLTTEFSALSDDSSINEIVMIYDTPGGVVTGISDFASLISASGKTVTSYIYGMAASAGYWLACAGDSIVSCDTGLVGSIGTIISFLDRSEKMKTEGVKEYTFVSSQSPNKNADYKTPEGAELVQQLVDDMSDVFIASVAKGRGVRDEKVLSDFGKGSVFVAGRAIEFGMIDKIQPFHEMISEKNKIGNRFLSNNNLEAKEMTQEILTVEGLSESHPALVAAIGASAKSDECKRIQACEALMSNFAASPVAVQSKIRAAIDFDKFDTEMTAEKLSMKLLSVVSGAQAEFVATQTAPAIAAAAIVEEITVEGADLDDAKTVAAQKSKKVVSGLAAALKNVPVKG